MSSYALVRPARLDLDAFARAAGVHPELVRRLITLGLLEPERGPAGEFRFTRAQVAALARVQRLHAGCALNYAAIGLVTDLLDRIAVLESELRRTRRPEARGPEAGGPEARGPEARRPGG